MRLGAFAFALAGCAATCLAATDETAVTLGRYSRAAREALEARIRQTVKSSPVEDSVSGVVSYVGEDCFFIQGAREGLKVIWANKTKTPAHGERVQALGTPSFESGHIVFNARTYEKVGKGTLPPPRAVTASDLFVTHGERAVNGLLVKIEGRVMGLTSSGFAMEVEKIPVNVFAENLPPFLEHCERTHPKVCVTGVAELILDQSFLMDREPYVMGVRIRVASPADIEHIVDALYLVNCRDRRMMLAIFGLIAALVCGLVALVVYSLRLSRRQLRNRTISRERKRMADDLHDTIEQHLVGAGMLLQLGRTKEAGEILVRAKREMRDIVWGLKNDEMLRQTPTQLIQQLAHEETTRGICRVSARLAGLPEKLDASQMRDLSLIVREAIGNAVKHGGAHKIAISSDPLPAGGWLLRIGNDGKPFDAAQAPGIEEGHFGIEGMKARARRLGATWSIAVDGAWTVVSMRHESLA